MPLSYLAALLKSAAPQPPQRKVPVRFSCGGGKARGHGLQRRQGRKGF